MRPHVIIITHTDWKEPDPSWIHQPLLPFRRNDRASWDRVMEDLGTRARVDAIAIGCRGTFDPEAVACLHLARAAYDAMNHQPAVTFWGDTVGLPDIAHNLDNPQNLAHRPFDFANPLHITLALEHFFRHFLGWWADANLLRAPNGKVLVPLWGIRWDNGHGFVNQQDAQQFLDAVDAYFASWGCIGAEFIVDRTWLEYAPMLRVYAVHDWFSGHNNPTSYTIREHRGVKTGVVVPSFFRNINPESDGSVARLGLQACLSAGCHHIICEGATDFSENAHWIRDHRGDDAKLNAIREITTGDDMSAVGSQPLFTFNHRAVIHNADGTKSLRWNKEKQQVDHTSNRVFSLQNDGSYDDRPLDKPSPDYAGAWGIGAWEKGTPQGNLLVFRVENARAVFAWQE